MHSFKIAVAFGFVTLLVTGCGGRVETRKLSDDAMNNTEKRITGVIIYQPAVFAEMSLKTTYAVNGKPAGSSKDNPPACTPVPSERAVALPDLKNPYIVTYSPGLFDSNTFGVTLQSGMLVGVNSNSTAPPNSGASASTPLGAIPIPTPLGIPLSAPAPTGGNATLPIFNRIADNANLPACNDGPMIVGYRRLGLP